jgi:hypothetical protein
MRKALRRVKKEFTSGSPIHDSSSHTCINSMSLDLSRPASYVPSPHGVEQSSYPPTQAKGMIDDDMNIFIRTHEELVRFKSLHCQEYANTHVCYVSLLERVGMDLELPTIFHTVRWEKLFEAPCSGSHLLTLEFLTTFKSFTKGRKSFVSFRLFGKEFEVDYSQFSELLDFSSSCILDPRAIKNFSRVDFYVEISEKSNRIRFSDIHNPTLRFLHRWMSFMLFLMRELHSITIVEVKCMYAMVHKIQYSPVADIVDYFKEIRTLAGPIECTSMVTRIALNIGCPKMAHVSYIQGDVPTLGLYDFAHAHILCEELDYSFSMLYGGGSKALRLPDPMLALYSCH